MIFLDFSIRKGEYMKKVCYFECMSGASGDMLLASMIGAGADKADFISELSKLSSLNGDYNIKFSKVIKNGILSDNVEVIIPQKDHHHRNLNDITTIVNDSTLDQSVKNLAVKIFTRLAIAESKVHGVSLEEVHFHEVGAIDSIIDIVGFSILYNKLLPDKVYISPVNVGYGVVKAAHGIIPIPAPATLELLQMSKWPINTFNNVEGELLTPTGAAILSEIKTEFVNFPSFNYIESISYGAGKRDIDKFSNVIRLTVGQINSISHNDHSILIEANIDDMNPEYYSYIIDKLFDIGVYDAFIQPIIMKKTRPACILSVICNPKDRGQVESLIFEETTTLGIRSSNLDRTLLEREVEELFIDDLGKVKIKIGKTSTGKVVSVKPEYEDCCRLAKINQISIKSVENIIKSKILNIYN